MPDIETARQWYSQDPVHGFEHVLRVYRLGERIGEAEHADIDIVRAAVLLHDVDASQLDSETDVSQRGEHHLSAAQFAGQILRGEGWPEERIAAVQHAIRAHRYRDRREAPKSPRFFPTPLRRAY